MCFFVLRLVKVSSKKFHPAKENPHQTFAKPMGAAVNFWGEPYAHPSQGFKIANLMPIRSPNWPGQVKSVGATTKEKVEHVQPTDALSSWQFSTLKDIAAICGWAVCRGGGNCELHPLIHTSFPKTLAQNVVDISK